jgi:hypothetical protein
MFYQDISILRYRADQGVQLFSPSSNLLCLIK